MRKIHMMLLEQYIEKRKKEDKLDEFDTEKKVSNIRVCIDYIFEYFDQYLPLVGAESHTSEENRLLQKYCHEIRRYSSETAEWLIGIYTEHGHKISRTIDKYLEKQEGFYLFYEESEFRSISYNFYADLLNKRPCLKNKTEELYQFIKEYHQIKGYEDYKNWGFPQISDELTQWLENTLTKYKVNINLAAKKYVYLFDDNVGIWPSGTRMKSDIPYPGYEYEYDISKSHNRFNINRFYNLYGNRPFLKGKKKQLEFLMLYEYTGGSGEIYESFLNDNFKL